MISLNVCICMAIVPICKKGKEEEQSDAMNFLICVF